MVDVFVHITKPDIFGILENVGSPLESIISLWFLDNGTAEVKPTGATL